MECPVIDTKLGKVKGRLSKNLDNDVFYSYLGVPYAKPPIGNLRFKAPEPAESWEGVRDSIKSGDPGYQNPNVMATNIVGSENCLWLNIHTKLTGLEGKLRPTIVYFFGGAFLHGNAGDWGPEYLLLEDLVIVFVNFRVGVWGLLALKDTSLEVTGNAALKDCVLALKWVRDNIESFGGDPNNVTIWGHSSGAVYAHLLTLSPATKGFIHRAIIHSCSAVMVDKKLSEIMYTVGPELVKLLGKTASEKEILAVLESASTEDLHTAQKNLLNKGIKMIPVVEKPNATAVLTKNPIDVIKTGEYNQIPLMIGYTNKEGLGFAPHFDRSGANLKDARIILEGYYYEYDVSQAIPPYIGTEEGKRQNTEDLLRNYYFHAEKWPEVSDGLWFLLGDARLLTLIISAAKHHIRTAKENVYIFRSDFEGMLDYIKNRDNEKSFKGVMHADDLGYIFKYYPVFPDPNFSEVERGTREEKAIRRYVKLIVNFARTGSPTPDDELKVEWKPAKDDKNIDVLNIGDDLKMMKYPEAERMALWENVCVSGFF